MRKLVGEISVAEEGDAKRCADVREFGYSESTKIMIYVQSKNSTRANDLSIGDENWSNRPPPYSLD